MEERTWGGRVYHEIEGMTKLHAIKNHSSLVQLSTVYLCSLANSSQSVRAHTQKQNNRQCLVPESTHCLSVLLSVVQNYMWISVCSLRHVRTGRRR